MENVAADFQYAGYYLHSRSGLSLTATRAYNTSFGRFINRDPIAELGGTNLYGYAANMPQAMSDPTGLAPTCPNPCPPNWTGHVVFTRIGDYTIWVLCYKGRQTGTGTVSGNGGSMTFSYNIGNGPLQDGANTASQLVTQQYYNNSLTVTAIAGILAAGIILADGIAGKMLADVERSLQWEWKAPDHTGGLAPQEIERNLAREAIEKARAMFERLFNQ